MILKAKREQKNRSGSKKGDSVVTSCEEAGEHDGKDGDRHQYREQLMAEERAPAPLLLHLLSEQSSADRFFLPFGFCLPREQLMYYIR